MRRGLFAIAAALLATAAATPGRAAPGAVVGDGTAIAFTMRPTYDPGGANPLHVYIGYADANVSTPQPEADGQASWYQLNIVETAAFRPAENCTPQRNAEATVAGLQDVQAWLSDYVQRALSSAQGGAQPPAPTVPGPRHACTERFPGFAQSRYPESGTIDTASSDSYFDKPTAASACREDPGSSQCTSYKTYWPQFGANARRFVRDGSFSARASDEPSQESHGLLFGVGDGVAVSIGSARTDATARIVDGRILVEARATFDDLCFVVSAEGCALRIDRMRQVARIAKAAGGKPDIDARTVILGVRGIDDVSADELHADQAAVDLGGYLGMQVVSKTGTCGVAEDGEAVADAGGIRLFGKGGQGGGITIGGACVRARIEPDDTPAFAPSSAPISRQIVPSVSELPDVALPGAVLIPRYGPARVVTRTITHVYYADPVAWRTMPYWASVLGFLMAGIALGLRYRAAPGVQPVVRALNRFARQFLRG